MCDKGVNFAFKKPPARLFIGLCWKGERGGKSSPVGCAIRLCAPLTDWNIPHRGLASLLLGQLSLSTRRKPIFDNCSLIIN